MLSGEGSESASSTSTTYYGSCLNMDPDVAARIASLLSSLRLTSLRNTIPQDGEEERLKKIHRQLEWLIGEEPDDHKRRRLRHILPAANCVREQVFALRRYSRSVNTSSINYATHIHSALTAIMKESFEEEYRKLATVVGVLDAVAELLIFEIDTFDIDCPVENRTIRKLIASTLTNLTFGNAQSKRRLCSHPNLIEYTIRIINNAHGLTQVYAGLLRNLSWMADAQMSATLAPSVLALVRASLRAYRTAELKCLCATLSALWNLASHSRDNKKALCEEAGFLEMLIELSTNDVQHTTLVEPATGVLKYASMYLAVVGTEQYLSSATIHMMMLRLVDLLNSPSFTVIGNALGILSQLLAKRSELRSHVVMNHKAMLLLNHLRNSTREDIRNPVKTVLNYLNSFDVSEVYVPTSSHPSVPRTPQLGRRFDGMSSSYDGAAFVAPSYVDSARLLKYRSSHSYAASVLTTNMSSTMNTEYFPYSSPLCAPTTQQGFAPRPGDRSNSQEQFASLPRQFFQIKQMQTAKRLSPVSTVKNMSISTTTTSSCAVESSQGNCESGDGDELKVLSRPDDPSFEVEDSVRCTRCTSTQSLSSLLPGERSTWNSCNNSAADSNRLSPVSTTEIPDSPTQCAPITAFLTQDFDLPSSAEGNETGGEMSTSKELVVKVSKSNSVKSIKPENNSNKQDSPGLENSLDDDYGSFLGRADSELLNQSIESAMPKRVEINEELLADMIEQAQPKPSPRKEHGNSGVHIFPTARTSNAKVDNDDFLLQSIASVLPQSSTATLDMSGIDSPPKKARAMAGDTARTSGGPKRGAHAVLSNSRNHVHSSVLPLKESRLSVFINMKTKFGNRVTTSNPCAIFDITEKIQDDSLSIHQDTNEESDTLSEENYNPLMSNNNMTVNENMPNDIDEESQEKQLVIDCNIVSKTVKQTAIKPMQKESHLQAGMSNLFKLSQQIVEKQSSEQEISSLPTPLSNCSSPNSCSGNLIVTSTPISSSSKVLTKFPEISSEKTSRCKASISKSTQQELSFSNTFSSKTLNSCVAPVKSSEDCKERSLHHSRSSRPKQSVLPKGRASSSSSNSKVSLPQFPVCGHRTATSDTVKISHNRAGSIYETIEPQAVCIQKLTKNRSAKILPVNHRNLIDKTITVAAIPEDDANKDTAESDDSETQCDNQSASEREKIVKQMLVTTV